MQTLGLEQLTLLLLMLMMTAPEGATLVLYEVGGPVPLELFTVTGVCSSALTPEASISRLWCWDMLQYGAASIGIPTALLCTVSEAIAVPQHHSEISVV